MIINMYCQKIGEEPQPPATFDATVVVTCPSGTTSCTLTKGNTVLAPTSSSGNVYTFKPAEGGIWTATASNGTNSLTSNGTVPTSGTSTTNITVSGTYPVPQRATLTVWWRAGQYCSLFDPTDTAVFEYDTSGSWSGTPSMTGLYYAVCSNADPTIRSVNVTSTTSGDFYISW